MVEADLEQPGASENRLNPLSILIGGVRLEPQQFRIPANHGQRSADFVDDPGQQSAHLRELLIEHRQAGHLAELDQATNSPEDDLPGRVLDDVIVGPYLKPATTSVSSPHRQHQDRDGDLAVSSDGRDRRPDRTCLGG